MPRCSCSGIVLLLPQSGFYPQLSELNISPGCLSLLNHLPIHSSTLEPSHQHVRARVHPSTTRSFPSVLWQYNVAYRNQFYSASTALSALLGLSRARQAKFSRTLNSRVHPRFAAGDFRALAGKQTLERSKHSSYKHATGRSGSTLSSLFHRIAHLLMTTQRIPSFCAPN